MRALALLLYHVWALHVVPCAHGRTICQSDTMRLLFLSHGVSFAQPSACKDHMSVCHELSRILSHVLIHVLSHNLSHNVSCVQPGT